MTLSKIGLSTALFALSMSFAALSAQAAGVMTDALDLQSSKPNISGVLWDEPDTTDSVDDSCGYCGEDPSNP